MSPVAVSRDELAAWCRHIQDICGICLDASKGYLVETRLAPLMKGTNATSYGELLHKVRADHSNRLRRLVIDAITTNETSFFRDGSPFEMIQDKLLPDLIARRNRAGVRPPIPIRVWSAACSTGQEVYSVAIAITNALGGLKGFDVRILGTDISDQAVTQASHGSFSKLEIGRGMPAEKLSRYFTPEGNGWKVRDELRALTSFRTLNLLEANAFPQRFDIILCRNVAIYFTEPDRIRLYRNIQSQLAPDGALVIGSTESLAGLCPELEPHRYMRSVFYAQKGAA